MVNETNDADERLRLLRAAAEAGPGYRSTRRTLSQEDKASLQAQLTSFGEAPPSYLLSDAEWIDRPAKLFEAGDYPDKGVSVTSEDLDLISQGFDLPVPVLIEHSESPLQLGFLTGVEARGRELFGTIALTKEADTLIERSGARSLSLGLSPDLRSIREVSLVRNPRVQSARLFSCVVFDGELSPSPSFAVSPTQVADWLREGRIVPAQAPFIKALLECGDAIEFDGSRQPLRQLVIAMVERQPPHALFSELAPTTNQEAAENLLLPEEAAFYRRHFPDVSLQEIASRR